MNIFDLIKVEWFYTKKYLGSFLLAILLVMSVFFLAVPKSQKSENNSLIAISIGIQGTLKDDPIFSLVMQNLEKSDLVSEVVVYEESDDRYERRNHDIWLELPDNLSEILYLGAVGRATIGIENPMLANFIQPLIDGYLHLLLGVQSYSLNYIDVLVENQLPPKEIEKKSIQMNQQLLELLLFKNELMNKKEMIPKVQLIVSSLFLILLIGGLAIFMQILLSSQLKSGLHRKYQLAQIASPQLLFSKTLLMIVMTNVSLFILQKLFFAIGFTFQALPFYLGANLLSLSVMHFLFCLTLLGHRKEMYTEPLILTGVLCFCTILFSGIIYPISGLWLWFGLFNPASMSQLIIEASFQIDAYYWWLIGYMFFIFIFFLLLNNYLLKKIKST